MAISDELLAEIVEEVVRRLQAEKRPSGESDDGAVLTAGVTAGLNENLAKGRDGSRTGSEAAAPEAAHADSDAAAPAAESAAGPQVDITRDITSRECKAQPLIEEPQDPQALARMMRLTTARIGVGCAGPRLKTQTLLALRADHANARDAVILDVAPEVLDDLKLFGVQTRCADKNEFLTRPDLGRRLNDEGVRLVKERCTKAPDVQLIVADGLSSTAINANIRNVLPVLFDGLHDQGISVGTPFFVKYGRVAVEDEVAQLLGAKVVCIFVGERPGLGSAESMSAYIAYDAKIGMPEARRTVVSNIHKDGITAVEAGAYLSELLAKILQKKASGVQLQN